MHIESRISLIVDSFAKLKTHKLQFTEHFYNQLFKKNPELKPLFSHTTLEAQSKKLYAALVLLVENLRHPEELEKVLLPLGKRHKEYGVLPSHYPIIEAVLLDSVKHLLKEDGTPEVIEAWKKTVGDVSSVMLTGAGEVIAKNELIRETVLIKEQSDEKMESSQNRSYELIENSFKKVKAYKEEFPLTFYKNLFEISPDLQPLFGKVEIKKQGRKLYGALLLLVESIRQPEKLKKVLGPLGDKHKGYGTTAEHYPIVGQALLMTLEEYLKEDWTSEVKQVWTDTFTTVAGMMLKDTPETVSTVEEKSSDKRIQSSSQGSIKNYEAKISRKQKSLLNQENRIISTITDWFWRVEKWKLALLISIFFFLLAPIKNEFIKSIIAILDPLSIVLALCLFIKEAPERKKQFHYNAWAMVDSANGIKKSNARIIALQDLCDEGVSLKGLDLANAELSRIELNVGQLMDANFAGAILKDAELYKADLCNANFANSVCTGIILSKANLGFASMHNANFSSADFSTANLMFADLSKGNYSGANFTNAQMKGANFDGAYMSGANFTGAEVNIEDLKKAYIVNATMPDGSIAK